jgi:chromosome segregation ATPase
MMLIAGYRQLKEDEFDTLIVERDRLQQEFAATRQDISNLFADGRAIKADLTASEGTINSFKDQIAAEKQKLENQGGAIAAISSRLQKAQTEHADAERAFNESFARQMELEKEKNALADARSQPVKELQDQITRVDDCRARIKKINKEGGQLSRSSQLRAVLNEISRTQWKQTPVGPISDYVFLKEPRWSPILERQFGGTLNSFVVTNKEDSTKLMDIIQKNRLLNTNTLIGSARPIDTTKHEPSSQFLTWMRALNITNDLVRNQLIINQGIEKTLLIEDREKANAVLSQGHQNVRQIFCFTDSQSGKHRGSGVRLQKLGTATSTSPIRPWGVNSAEQPRMRMDVNAQLGYVHKITKSFLMLTKYSMEKENLQQEEQSLVDRQAALRVADNEHNSKANEFNTVKRQVNSLKVKRDQLEEKISRIKDDLDEATPQNGKIETLQAELDKKEQDQEVTLNQWQEYKAEMERKNEEQKAMKGELNKMSANISTVKGKVDALLKQLTNLQQKTQDKLYAKNEHDASVRNAIQNKENQEQDYQQQKAKLDEIIDQATSICARVRVPPNETYETLEVKFDKIKRDLAQAQTRAGGSEEELKQREVKAKEEYDERVETHQQHHDLAVLIKSTLNERRLRWKKFRDFIALKASTSFSLLLSERQFRGKLSFKHDSKELDIQVEPDITRKSDTGRQTKTLSGGEKSFSTICLLLALWDAMGSPIRCLDEL